MSNHNGRTTQGKSVGIAAVDLASGAQQALAESQAKAAATAEIADAYEQARSIDTAAVAKRLPSGHVMLPRFPDGELVVVDAARVAAIEPMQPAGWVDLSKLGEDRPSVCDVTYEYGHMMFVGTVEQVAGILFGDGQEAEQVAKINADALAQSLKAREVGLT